MASVRSATYAVLASASDATTSSSLNASRLKDILKFALQAVRITSKLCVKDLKAVVGIWDLPQLNALAEKLAKSERFGGSSSLHQLCKQLASLIQPPAKKDGKKEKKVDASEGVDVKETASSEGAKTKKENKRKAVGGKAKGEKKAKQA